MRSAREPLLLLDPLRLAAALMVVAHHYAAILPVRPPDFLAPALAGAPVTRAGAAWTHAGWIGVEIFFVISGYVIAFSAGRGSAGDFVRRRVLRLAPAVWICASVTAAVTMVAGGSPAAVVGQWARALLFWPAGTLIDGSYWTLPIECVFYALVAATLRRGGVERLAGGLALASALFWCVAAARAPGADTAALDLTVLPHGCFFAAGIMLWAIHAGGATGLRLGLLALALGTGAVQIVARSAVLARQFALPDDPRAALATFAAAVALIALAPRLQGALRRIGAARLRVAGLVTYPLYLLHQNVGAVLIVVLRGAIGDGAAMVAAGGVMLTLAALVAVRAEPWLRGVLDRALSPARGPAQDIPPTASLPAG